MEDSALLPARHKLDVDAYHRMADAGIFDRDARIELIDGELIDMAPIGQGHAGIVNRLTEALVMACQGRAIVSVQNPVQLDRHSEPQPDISILRRRDDFYEAGEPARAADVLLLIEVADSSLHFDRTVKLRLYARTGIPEYWIVDKKRRVVDVHRQPSAAGYDDVATMGPGTNLPLAIDPDIIIDLGRVLG